MSRIVYSVVLTLLFLASDLNPLHAQGRFIRRLQQEVERKAIEEIFEKGKEEAGEAAPAEAYRPGRHRMGGGLSQEVPDVEQAISDAETSLGSNDFGGSRAALRRAVWGIELQMGHQVLESLPLTVGGVEALTDHDRVSSSGMGFSGMLIERVYAGGEDMELVVSVGNDAGLLGVAGMILAAEMYRESAGQEHFKQIRFQDHRAYIEYDDYEGYALTTPFGQSSILVIRGLNYSSEEDFMASAGQIDLHRIKQKLGIQ